MATAAATTTPAASTAAPAAAAAPPAASDAKSATTAAAANPAGLPVVRVGGVPEHFNLSWHLAIERGLFAAAGVHVQWVEIKEGTGAMITQLKEGKVDLIVALTEGLVSDIAKDLLANDAAAAAAAPAAATADTKTDATAAPAGAVKASSKVLGKASDVCLVSAYVESPLTWAISTGAKSAYHSVEDLKGSTIGISRYTSGSHLMTCVLAAQRGWQPATDLSFVVKGDFASLRNSVNDGSSAAFMWEHFTTKPYHDSGEVRRIGDITTPWPCFLVASRRAVVDAKADALHRVFGALRDACAAFNTEPDMPLEVSRRYGLKPADALAWYRAVRITASAQFAASAIDRALSALRDSGVLPPASVALDAARFVDTRFLTLLVDIKSMKLYNKPELITALYNNLRAIGKAKGPLSFRDLLAFDQNHYHGTEALDLFVEKCGLKGPALAAARRVVHVGSSLGGCARYLAGAHGLDVLAVELQLDLHAVASELTSRCTEQEVKDRVTLMGGDFLTLSRHLALGQYQAVCSWLTVLHFAKAERLQLFKQCYALLAPGGVLYAEDFVALAPLTAEEQRVLRTDVFCEYLPNTQQYIADLNAAGFVTEIAVPAASAAAAGATAAAGAAVREGVKVESLTADWTAFTAARVKAFASDRKAQIERHGDDLYHRLLFFYRVVSDLFAGGHVGGIRVVAHKPATAAAASAMPSASTALKRQATY